MKLYFFTVLLLVGLVLVSGCTSSPHINVSEQNQTQEIPDFQNETKTVENKTEKIEEQHIESKNTEALSDFRNDPEIPSEKEKQQLPDCLNAKFSISPVDLGKVIEISPLGNLGPPGHTYPTEHVFFHITAGGETTNTLPLSAPADVYITSITSQFGVTQDPEDHTIWFALCKDIVGYYNHVKELSPEMNHLVEKSGCKGKPHVGPNSCNIKVLEPVKLGSILGRIGRLQGNFDFGLIDLSKNLVFDNPERYGTRTKHIQCPFNYYDENTKK